MSYVYIHDPEEANFDLNADGEIYYLYERGIYGWDLIDYGENRGYMVNNNWCCETESMLVVDKPTADFEDYDWKMKMADCFNYANGVYEMRGLRDEIWETYSDYLKTYFNK